MHQGGLRLSELNSDVQTSMGPLRHFTHPLSAADPPEKEPAGGFGVMRDVSVSANHSLVTEMDFPL